MKSYGKIENSQQTNASRLQVLANNDIGRSGVKVFSDLLAESTQLRHIDLSGNSLTDEDAALLATALSVSSFYLNI